MLHTWYLTSKTSNYILRTIKNGCTALMSSSLGSQDQRNILFLYHRKILFIVYQVSISFRPPFSILFPRVKKENFHFHDTLLAFCLTLFISFLFYAYLYYHHVFCLEISLLAFPTGSYFTSQSYLSSGLIGAAAFCVFTVDPCP